MNNKYFCVHACFDLPPQEDPWLGRPIEDPSAFPFRDWLQRLFHDCYGPLSASPLADSDGAVLELRDNYRDLSFDFSPETLDWMEREQPQVYARILEADASSVRSGGCGSALASPHPSLAAASPRDRRTAVLWGLSDFRRRFSRDPDGIRLPEGGAAPETLELLAQLGLRFALLPASAAKAARASGSDADWTPVDAFTVDVTRPYRWNSESGKRLSIFFHRAESVPEPWRRGLGSLPSAGAGIAASPAALEAQGRGAAVRLAGMFTSNDAAQLSHIVVDGHVFGHLRAQGYRALAAALDGLGRDAPARRAGYAEFLDLFPAPQEVLLHPRAAPVAGEPWRQALERLAPPLDARFEALCRGLLKSPWEARDAYGAAPPDTASLQAFLDRYCARHLTLKDARRALRLCEAQRWRMRMLSAKAAEAYALACAARAIELLREGAEDSLESDFVAGLPPGSAKVYQGFSRGGATDLERAAAHFCVSGRLDALFGAPVSDEPPASFRAAVEALGADSRPGVEGERSLTFSRADVRHLRTHERGTYLVAVHHKGRLELECWTQPERDPASSRIVAEALLRDFQEKDERAFREAAEALFGPARFGLDALFAEERRRAVQGLLPHGPPARREFLERWGRALGEFRASPKGDPEPLEALLEGCSQAGLLADSLPGVRLLRDAVVLAAQEFASGEQAALERLCSLLETIQRSGLHVSVWELQDLAWQGLAKLRARLQPEEIKGTRRLASLLGLSGASLLTRPAAGSRTAEEIR